MMPIRADFSVDKPIKWVATSISLIGLGVLLLALTPVVLWAYLWCWLDDRRKNGL